MFRRLIVALAFFATAAAPEVSWAQSGVPTPEIHIRAQGDEVRLFWLPLDWPAGLEGFELRRQVVGEKEWVSLGTFKPRDVGAYLTSNGRGQLYERILSGFDFPLKNGFGYVDQTIPADNGVRVYSYGLFPIMNGKVAAEPSNTRYFQNLDRRGRNVGLRPHEILWLNLGIEIAEVVFQLDGAQLLDESLGYSVYEQRGNAAPKLLETVKPPLKAFDSKFVCHRSSPPYPDSVTLVVEDMYGFTSSASIAIKKTGENVRRGEVASSKCAGTPQAVSLPRPPFGPPPPPPLRQSQPPSPPPRDGPVERDAPVKRNPSSLLGMASLWLAANNTERVDERVVRWPDQSASHNDASMTDPARRPRVVKLENGKRALLFENNQALTLASPIAHAQMTIFIVGRNREPAGTAGIILGPAGKNPNHQIRWESDDEVLVVGPGNGAPVTRLRVGDTRKMHVLAMRYDGESVSFWRSDNPNAVSTAAVRGASFTFNSIGSYFSQQFLDGEIAEIVVIPRALDPGEIARFDTLLRFTSGLP